MSRFLSVCTVLIVICILLVLVVGEESLNREERGARRGNRNRDGGRRRNNNNNKKNACKYEKPKGSWGPCVDGKKVRNATLVRSRRGQQCEPFKVIERDCTVKPAKVQKCRYSKQGTKWSDCVEGKRTKVLNLAPNQGTHCNQTKEITKPCRVRSARQERDSVKRCKYEKGDWTDCVNGKRTRTKKLKPGSPTTCEAEQVQEKNCKDKKKKGTKACKYQPDGNGWSPCTSGQKVKMLTLKQGSPTTCEASKTMRKRCKVKACKYKKGSIGECDQATNMVNRTDVIKDNMASSCPPTQLVQVPCNKPNARPKACKYGPWKQYGPCMNGVKRKTRDITMGQGNQRCEKKAVKIMACEDQSENTGNK